MKGRGGGNGGAAAADLLICFPSRAHLALMPKPICSPSRAADGPKRSTSRGHARGHASPLFKTRARSSTAARGGAAAEAISEPTSPKVTCAGQIKVSRPKPRPPASGGRKSWLSVVAEMEDLRRRRQRGRGHWLEALGIKKDALHFLHAFRGLRLRMSCFGSFRTPGAGCTSDEEEDDSVAGEEEEEEEENAEGNHNDAPQTVFSKWFMLLEESRDGSSLNKVVGSEEEGEDDDEEEGDDEERGEFGGSLVAPASLPTSPSAPPPPPNALLLMRSRSAPAKGWPSERVLVSTAGGREDEMAALKMKEEEKEKERLILMSYAPDFFKLSADIAKETWVVGSFNPLARSRSCRR